MKNNKTYNYLSLFSPLDWISIFYILSSAIYICFGLNFLNNFLFHFVIRIILLFFIVSLAFITKKNPTKTILFLKNLYPLIFLGFFYTETSYLKNIIFKNNLDAFFFNLEQNLWGCQPSIEFSNLMNQNWFNELMNICYFSYYILITLVCIFIYLKKPLQSYKNIFIIVLSFYFYYIFFFLFPVAGPQYYIQLNGNESIPPHFFGKIMQYILINIEEPTGAFPSSHVGIAIIINYIVFKELKKIFYFILPFVFGICFATVYLKAHYLVDVLAGILSAPILIIFTGKIYDKLSSITSNNFQNSIQNNN